MKLRYLKCCVCGAAAGKYAQHWNRDTGYGVCRKCVDWELSRNVTPEEIHDLYGIAGVNYEAKQFIQYGRSFNILAEFPDTEPGRKAANDYMMAHDNASLIAVVNGVAVLADTHDHGTEIKAA